MLHSNTTPAYHQSRAAVRVGYHVERNSSVTVHSQHLREENWVTVSSNPEIHDLKERSRAESVSRAVRQKH